MRTSGQCLLRPSCPGACGEWWRPPAASWEPPPLKATPFDLVMISLAALRFNYILQGHIFSTTKSLPTRRPRFSQSFPAPVPITMRTSLLLSTIQLALTGAELTCYYPDTTEATGHIPCNATASNTSEDASACCFGYGNDYCLANGLCWFDGILSRGSCTDKNWAAPSCAQWCQEGNELQFEKRYSDLHSVRGED